RDWSSDVCSSDLITMPLSLNEPVGFAPSYLTCNPIPSISDMFSQYIKGVWPSFKLTLGVSAVTGKYSLNSSTSPCQFFINIKLLQLGKFSVQHNLILELFLSGIHQFL